MIGAQPGWRVYIFVATLKCFKEGHTKSTLYNKRQVSIHDIQALTFETRAKNSAQRTNSELANECRQGLAPTFDLQWTAEGYIAVAYTE